MRSGSGFTFVELLVVLVVLGVIAFWIKGLDAQASLEEASRSAAQLIVSHRLSSTLQSRFTCIEDLARLRHVAQVPLRGLAFGLDGLPRTCDGSGVGNTTILLEHRGRQAAVIVSSLGRVRWELR
jgi:prepilin-type N-terminal cleavage/methylation domain-containing protein